MLATRTYGFELYNQISPDELFALIAGAMRAGLTFERAFAVVERML